MSEDQALDVLGDLVDALNDDLSYEISKSPEVQRQILRAIGLLGEQYQSYADEWWLIA